MHDRLAGCLMDKSHVVSREFYENDLCAEEATIQRKPTRSYQEAQRTIFAIPTLVRCRVGRMSTGEANNHECR
jgi:hypothetical protein